MSRRRTEEFREQLETAVDENDTVAVERILQEYGELGDNCDIPHSIWVELCEAALKKRCLPMVKLVLPPKSLENNFADVETNKRLMNAAIKSDFLEGFKFLNSKGISLYFAHSISRYNWSALTECVRNNRVEVLKYLLELKDLDKTPNKDETLLMLCCHELNMECLEILLNSEVINTINQQSKHRQYSALHYCIGGRDDLRKYCFDGKKLDRVRYCVKLLVESGADVNLEGMNGTTPIQMAAAGDMVTTVTYLAKRGANLDLENKQGTLLHCLADSEERAHSYDECIQLLVTKGMDINKLNPSNETPLYLAVCQGKEEMARSLIKSHCDVNIKVGDDLESVLMASIGRQQETITELLIHAGCDVNSADTSGVTPLMEGVKMDNLVLVKQLIDHGAFVNAKDDEGCFVLDYLFQSYHHPNDRSSSADIVKMMIKAGADIHKCDKLLCRAINHEDYETASLLIEHGIDVNTVDGNGDNPLALSSTKCNIELVKLLTTTGCEINHQNRGGETALHKAIQVSRYSAYNQDRVEIINTLLLQHGINVNLRDVDGKTALSTAVGNGERSIVKDLLKAGADIDHRDRRRRTPLMIAVNGKDTVMANILLKAGADLKPSDELGRNAIHLAAFLNVSLDLDVLNKYSNLRSEAETIVNASDINGKTPFMVAAERGSKAMVEELLRAGSNINLQDPSGKTALMFALDNQDETILSLLLENGADYNICDNTGQTALMVAVNKQKEMQCEDLLKSDASVNHVDNNGNTALSIAVKMNNGNIVNSLLKAGADVNHGDKIGATPLMNVNNQSIAESLLKAGADFNRSDNNGKTALMTAARNCNRPILECLLNAGADVNKTDTDGRSAIHSIMVGSRGRGDKWINCLKLLLINKCHVCLDTQGEGEDGTTLFQWLQNKNKEDLLWYLVTENCPLNDLDLPKVKDKFQFPDILLLSKILFESGAPKSRIETMILMSVLNTDLSLSPYNHVLEESEDKQQLDEFRDFCKSRSLKSRCRREIRNCIGSGISSKITQVGLPKYLQDYVVMKDLIPDKYFTLVIDDKDDSNARSDNIAGLMFALMASSAFPIYGGYDSDDSNDGNYYYEPDYYSDNYYYDSSD